MFPFISCISRSDNNSQRDFHQPPNLAVQISAADPSEQHLAAVCLRPQQPPSRRETSKTNRAVILRGFIPLGPRCCLRASKLGVNWNIAAEQPQNTPLTAWPHCMETQADEPRCSRGQKVKSSREFPYCLLKCVTLRAGCQQTESCAGSRLGMKTDFTTVHYCKTELAGFFFLTFQTRAGNVTSTTSLTQTMLMKQSFNLYLKKVCQSASAGHGSDVEAEFKRLTD